MRHVPILVAILTLTSVNACYPYFTPEDSLAPEDLLAPVGLALSLVDDDPGPFIRLQVRGTVTAADGSLIAGASVKVVGTCREGCVRASTTADDSGRYSLSFKLSCAEENFYLEASAEGFLLRNLWYFSDPHLRCTKELQTIDLQLEREPT